tara:strand:+ start:2023 stop:2181 length:159 start_codon:yes stop_codon:yes gene_type:complete
MRATEFIDLITRKQLPEEDMYTHFDYRDEEGDLLKEYIDLRREYRKRIKDGK